MPKRSPRDFAGFVKEESRKLLAKAARAVEAAELLLVADSVDFAAGRAYYAMFYAAEAVLNEMGLRFRKHAGVHAAFGEHLAKPRLVDPSLHRWLLDAFDKRLVGDYGIEASLSATEVTEMIEHARDFAREVQRFINTGQTGH